MRLIRFLFALAVASLAAVHAQAQVTYSYVTDASSYTGTVGSTVTIGIYLQESLQNGATSYITTNGGVFNAGAGLNAATTTLGTAAQIQQGTFSNTTTGFNNGIMSSYYNQTAGPVNNSTGNNLEFVEGTPGAVGLNPTSGKIFLGDISVTVGSGTTTYDLTSLNNDTIANSNSFLGQSDGNTELVNTGVDGKDLDSVLNNAGSSNPNSVFGADSQPAYTFTVGPASVPEPSSVILTGMAGVLFGFGAWRRRRRLARDNSESAAPVLAMA